MKITIDIDEQSIQDITRLMTLSGKNEGEVIGKIEGIAKAGIESYIQRYRNRDNVLDLRKVYVSPTEYEVQCYENEFRIKNDREPSKADIDNFRKDSRELAYLIEETSMMGTRYAVIWNPENDTITKNPMRYVKFEENE